MNHVLKPLSRRDYFSSLLGVNVSLRVPLSWKQGDDDRPYVVSKWTSQYGSGSAIISLIINEFKGPTMSHEDVLELVKADDWEWMVPNGFNLIEGRAVTVNRNPAIETYMKGESRSLDLTFQQIMKSYTIFLRGNTVQLMCIVNFEDNVSNDMCRGLPFARIDKDLSVRVYGHLFFSPNLSADRQNAGPVG